MKLLFCLMLAAGLAAPRVLAEHSDQWPVREQATTTKTLTLSGQPNRVVIDNLQGHVHATGAAGSEVRFTVHKTIRAETEADLQKARQEVDLKLTSEPGTVTAYYAAPWRCEGEHRNCNDNTRRFYRVTYDIDVQVPRDARLVASTINEGDVRLDNTTGPFDLKNINGSIVLTAVSGSGTADTINGALTARFAKNPTTATSFKTLNGQMDIYLQPNLSADLAFKTFNGQIFTDFDLTSRVAIATQGTRNSDGKFIYRREGLTAARAGNGGPPLSFDAFNGDIRLHSSK